MLGSPRPTLPQLYTEAGGRGVRGGAVREVCSTCRLAGQQAQAGASAAARHRGGRGDVPHASKRADTPTL